MVAEKRLLIEGSVSNGFEPVREAFVENFTRRGELGAACCVYRRRREGRRLMGWSQRPRERRALARRHDGHRPLDDQGPLGDGLGAGPFPRLAGLRREGLHVLARVRAGREGADHRPSTACSSSRAVRVRREGRPRDRGRSRSPGRDHGPAAAGRGSRASDRPTTRSASASTRASLCVESTLGIAAWVCSSPKRSQNRSAWTSTLGPRSRSPTSRLAPLEPPSLWKRLTSLPLPLVLAAMNRRSVLYRSLVANPGTGFYVDPHGLIVRNLEVPSGGGVGSARAIAKAYGVFASGGLELGASSETLEALEAPAVPSRHGFFDECFRGPAKFSLGFMKPSESVQFGHSGAFGAPGAGGSMGYADPQCGIGYGYVTNRMGMNIQGDPRRRRAASGDPDNRTHILTTASGSTAGATLCGRWFDVGLAGAWRLRSCSARLRRLHRVWSARCPHSRWLGCSTSGRPWPCFLSSFDNAPH